MLIKLLEIGKNELVSIKIQILDVIFPFHKENMTNDVWNSRMLCHTTDITDIIHLSDGPVTCRIHGRKYMLLH
jgi:hypothetical protein